MKKSLIAGVLSIMILLTGCIQQPDETSASEPPATGDWIVTRQQSVEDKTVTLNGNLIIKSGGSLTLTNTRLLVNSSYDGQYKISVEPDGSMYIYGSKITAADLEHRFAFIVKGAAFVMTDSELHGCGWGHEEQDPSGIPEVRPVSFDAEGFSVAGLFIETDRAIIESNLISNNFAALVLMGNGITIMDNTIDSNDYNPISVFGSDIYIGDNVIQHSVLSGWGRCIDLHEGNNNTIANNTLSSESQGGPGNVVSGIHVGNSWSNTIDNNTLTDLNGFGIYLGVAVHISSNNIIANNTISVGEFGISVHGRNNRIEGNSIEGASTGIDLTYSYNNMIVNNILSEVGDSHHAIRLCHSSNNIIVSNEISSVVSSGIYMWRSSKSNAIQGNIISSSQQGISIHHSSDDNTISNNQVSFTQSGVIIDNSSGNIIYSNNFIDSGERYDNSDNLWDFEGIGNYWSDYAGRDWNEDGIGDDPHSIQSRGVDNHPLMEPTELEPAAIPELDPITVEDPPPYITISEEEVWENQTIVLDTELNIQDGGILTLRNVNLILGSESHAGYIRIKSGGTLDIYQSTITDTETGYGGRFEAEEGSTFIMRDSQWHGVFYDWWNGGFEIYGADVIIENNTFTGVSILLIHVSGAYFGNNTVLDSLCPILLMQSSNSTIENNTISGSLGNPIQLIGGYGGTEAESTNNLIHHNNFIDYAIPAYDAGSNNYWDHNGEGNYWSDYESNRNGRDEDGDGIGDTPYGVGQGVDNYPLMEPYNQ